MGEIEEALKEIRERIEGLKRRSEIRKRIEEISARLEKIEKEPGRRKSLDGCYDIEKEEVKWPSFEEWFE